MPADPALLAALLMKPTPRPALINDPPNPVYEAEMKASPYYKEFPMNYGAGAAPQLSGGDYNLQRAWQLGLKPERDPYDKNRLHWPDRAPTGEMLKTPDHPTVWMQHFMDVTGGQNPEALGIKDYASAKRYLGRDFVPPDVLSAIKRREGR